MKGPGDVGVPQDVYDMMVALRRDLHRYPELSFEEERTAEAVAERLTELEIPFRSGVGGYGIVAELAGATEGPAVAVRGDMDALPVDEETELPFASLNHGVMHACGHDGHVSMLVGAAALLKTGDPPPVPVRFLFQPAEERGAGAQALIAEGALDGVGMIFSGHLDRHYPVGALVVTEGPVNAATDKFRIEIEGQQGHGARPHESLDAIVVGGLLITALQTIISREVDPAHPSVISIGTFHAGTAANVIAGHAVLEGTIRSQHEETRAHLNAAVARIAHAVGQLHGARVMVNRTRGMPPVVNSPGMTDLAREAARAVVGPEAVVPLRTANMGGEDFAYYLDHVPGCYIRFGAQVPGREGFPAHSSRFDFDELALATSAAWLERVARLGGARLREGAE